MMRKLGKWSGAAVLGCLLCLALCSTGAFAQSAAYNTANGAARSVTTHMWQGENSGVWSRRGVRSHGWRGGWYGGWYGGRYGHRSVHRFWRGGFDRFIRVTRMMRVTQIIHITQVRIIRVTRMIRVTQFRRVSSCGGGC